MLKVINKSEKVRIIISVSFIEYFKLDEYGNMIWQLERLSGLELELKTE